jgi:signal transduction histidine kinase
MRRATGSASGRMVFRPRARMVKILGEHLIRDNTVGLMELVKNAYDADASCVEVSIRDVREPVRTVIVIQDDGDGMTADVMRGAWLEPAHGGKEEQKSRTERTRRGRLPLGEKGVGRFASQRLGHSLEVITRPRGASTEAHLVVDWDDFEDSSRYLDEVELRIRDREPKVFLGKAHGTRLTMTGAREPWHQRDLRRFQASLMRLVSPHRGLGDFRVIFRCPEFPELEDLDATDITDRYQFRIDCVIDEKGRADYEYRWRQPDGTEEVRSDQRNLWAQVNPDGWTERDPACGPFFVQISAWLLRAKLLQEYGLNREQLRVLGGVSLYRDGFRVLPYGDAGDDWLGLDQRRINVPAERFGNRQVVGVVEIDQVSNRSLIDKTNREGLQENQAYFDLGDLVLGVVQTLEQESLEQRQRAKSPTRTRKELETTIDDLKSELERLTQEAPAAEPASTAAAEDTGTATEEMVLVPRSTLEELEERAQAISESVAEIYESQDEEREVFLHLLGIGLAAERFAHEFDICVDHASRSVQAIKPVLCDADTDTRKWVELLDVAVNVLRNEVRLMGALRYVRRSQRAADASVRTVVELVLMAYGRELGDSSVRLETSLDDDFTVHISEASLAQVVDNLVNNAIHWLKQKSDIADRRLKIQVDASERAILVSNNGPAVIAHVRPLLFRRPFVTAKQNGRGLGMYIAGQILQRNGGAIRLISPEEDHRVLDGAAFKIAFKAGKGRTAAP